MIYIIDIYHDIIMPTLAATDSLHNISFRPSLRSILLYTIAFRLFVIRSQYAFMDFLGKYHVRFS